MYLQVTYVQLQVTYAQLQVVVSGATSAACSVRCLGNIAGHIYSQYTYSCYKYFAGHLALSSLSR